VSLSVTIEAMIGAGCSADQIAAVVRALEAEEAERDLRSPAAIRQSRYRERKRNSGITERNGTVTNRNETVTRDVTLRSVSPVSPPRDNINSTPLFPPSSSEANASLVDETVDVGLSEIEKQKKKALREELQSLGEQWNGLAAAFRLPTIEEIKPGSKRERHALARLRDMPPNGVQALMGRIRSSPYLRGEINGFRCTFDFLVNADNYQKIMDGNYEDRKISHFRR
jgi:hypothetical protein